MPPAQAAPHAADEQIKIVDERSDHHAREDQGLQAGFEDDEEAKEDDECGQCKEEWPSSVRVAQCSHRR
jgi:hypothetical protein